MGVLKYGAVQVLVLRKWSQLGSLHTICQRDSCGPEGGRTYITMGRRIPLEVGSCISTLINATASIVAADSVVAATSIIPTASIIPTTPDITGTSVVIDAPVVATTVYLTISIADG